MKAVQKPACLFCADPYIYMASLKTNVLLNYINTFTSIAFPVITFPYATRVLLLDGIGLANFYGSLVNYITLFSGIGIQMYAAKEVARHRDNVYHRNKCTVEIAILGLLFCVLGYVAVALMGLFVPRIHAHLDLFLVLSLSIFFTVIGVDWFYRAIEDFTFITVRAVLFRALAAVSLFVFVRSSDDLLAYCLVTVSLSVGNNFINFIHLRKYISLRTIPWRELNVWHHLPRTLKIFIPNLVTNMYGHLNIAMLGFMQSAAIVGLYSAGSKLVLIALSVINSLSIVLLPRSSNLIETGHYADFASISLKAVRLVILLSLPGLALMALLAPQIVVACCGGAFAPSSVVVACTAPVLLIVGLSNIIGIQILYSQGRERIVIGSMLAGVVLNVILNLALIPSHQYMGAALSMLLSETFVLVVQLVVGRKYVPFRLRDLGLGKYLTATLLLALSVLMVTAGVDGVWLPLIAGVLLGGGIYVLSLYFMRDTLFSEMLHYTVSMFRRR